MNSQNSDLPFIVILGVTLKKKKKKIIKFSLFILIPLLLLIVIIYSSYYYEHQVSPNIKLYDIIESTIVILMGEYPGKAISLTSRILQLILLVFGTVAFGAIVGKMSSLFVLKASKVKNKSNLKNHYIICNWNSNGKNIIKQLQKANKKSSCKIVVISLSEIKNITDLENITFVHKDPMDHKTLGEYDALKAKSVILLAEADSRTPDEKNALIALAIKYLEGEKNKDIRIIAELKNSNFKKHLKDAGVDEIIYSADYSSGIIAQSAIFKSMSEIYRKLLSYSDTTNEIYFSNRYIDEFIGKSFAEVSQLVYEKHKENPVILMGVKREEQIHLNPKEEDIPNGIDTNDYLIYLSYFQIN